MRRRWNIPIWAGFAVVLLALFSYLPVFSLFPFTRDFPWVNLLLFLAGLCLLALGLNHAFREPKVYRGKVAGSILAVLSLRINTCRTQFGNIRPILLWDIHRFERRPSRGQCPTRWPGSARFHPRRRGWESGSSFRSLEAQSRRLVDFLPRILVTVLHLRVTGHGAGAQSIS